jgi:plastocyanin
MIDISVAMNYSRTTINVILVAGVALALILAASFAGMYPIGQNLSVSAQTGNSTSSESETNSDEGEQAMQPMGPTIDPNKRRIVLSGTVSSIGDPADPSFNAVDLLPARMDGYIYSGTVTFAASKKVLVGVYQPYGITNSSMIDASFGEPFNFPVDEQNKVAISVIEPDYGTFAGPAATISFVGSGLTLATLDSSPFVVTYSITAYSWKTQVYNEVSSAMPGNVTSGPMPQNPVSINLGNLVDSEEFYAPSSLTIPAGETVTWTNEDFLQHTVTSGTGFADSETGMEFGSYLLSQGGAFEHTFENKGHYNYYCQVHPFMKGVVIVE